MSRTCTTCHHLKRPEIDRRLAAGEPTAQVARDFDINPSSLHRHRANCLKLASANAIMKEAARGTAAMTLLPSKEDLGAAYLGLMKQIDEIVAQARQEGSLKVAISGLSSIRQTIDSMSRLAGHDRGRHQHQRGGADQS
jgi:transposase-like protein